MNYIKIDMQNMNALRCPFGIRDLNNDECYSGNGQNRCPYFVKYDWESEHAPCVQCTCDKPRIDERGNKYVIDEDGHEQLVFDF